MVEKLVLSPVETKESGSPWALISVCPSGVSPEARSTLRVAGVTRAYDTAFSLKYSIKPSEMQGVAVRFLRVKRLSSGRFDGWGRRQGGGWRMESGGWRMDRGRGRMEGRAQ